MKKMALWLLLILAVTVPAGAKPGPKHITLYGTGNPAVDPDNLRDAIAMVRTNGTITLVGSFQFDGSFVFIDRGHITIEGIAVDNDGDGSINEDWADGVDNDGDGATDEDDWDAQLNGILDIDGRPVDDLQPPDYTFFNRGLTLWGATKDVTRITIRNIKFFGFNRGIEFGADSLFKDGIVCSEIEDTGGTVKHSMIEGNWFDNNERGLQVFGSAKDITVRDNVFTNTVRAYAIPLVAGGVFCLDDDGNNSAYEVGTPTRIHVVDNRFVGGEVAAVGLFGATRSSVVDNVVDGFFRGIAVEGEDNLVLGNEVRNIGDWAILPLGVGDGTLISGNAIDGASFGLLFSGASGFIARDNPTAAVSVLDYYLNPASSNNVVRLLAGQTVFDQGTDNDVQ